MTLCVKAWFVIAAVLSMLLGFNGEPKDRKTESCMSTTFGGPGDKWAGQKYHCLNIPTKTKGVRGVAHRWLPCDTEVTITNRRTGLTTTAPVIDHGPYGALLPKGAKCPSQADGRCVERDGRLWYVKRKKAWPGEYRGCLDITKKVADEIDHDGWEMIDITYKLPSRKDRPSS